MALRSVGGTENANTQRACWAGDLRGPVQFYFLGHRPSSIRRRQSLAFPRLTLSAPVAIYQV